MPLRCQYITISIWCVVMSYVTMMLLWCNYIAMMFCDILSAALWVHNNTQNGRAALQEKKTGKAWEMGGDAQLQICTLNWRVSYKSSWVCLIMLMSGVLPSGGILDDEVQCVVLKVDLTPLCPPYFHLTSFICSKAFPVFLFYPSVSIYDCEHKPNSLGGQEYHLGLGIKVDHPKNVFLSPLLWMFTKGFWTRTSNSKCNWDASL